MKNNERSVYAWFEEIWEEIEIQFYGIIGALIFFSLLYILFRHSWMNPLINFLNGIGLI